MRAACAVARRPDARHRVPGRPPAARRAARGRGGRPGCGSRGSIRRPRLGSRIARVSRASGCRPSDGRAAPRQALAAGGWPSIAVTAGSRCWSGRSARTRNCSTCRWTARPGARTPNRSTWSARTASTTPAARCAGGTVAAALARRPARPGLGVQPPRRRPVRGQRARAAGGPALRPGAALRRRRVRRRPRRPARSSARCCAGASACPRSAQAALAFAYEHLAVRRRDALRVLSASPVRQGLAEVRIDRSARPAGRHRPGREGSPRPASPVRTRRRTGICATAR